MTYTLLARFFIVLKLKLFIVINNMLSDYILFLCITVKYIFVV